MTGTAVSFINFFSAYSHPFLQVICHFIWRSYMCTHLSFCYYSKLCSAEFCFITLIHYAPYFSLLRITDVQRTVRPLRKPHWPALRICCINNSIHSGETICKNFPFTRRFAIFKRNKSYKITRLGIRCTYSRTMKSNEGTIFIMLRELITCVKQQIIRSPVAGESDQRLFVLFPIALFLSIPAIFRVQYFFALHLVVEVVRPADISTFFYS